MRINPDNSVQVWDRFVRFFHWALVAAFAIAYLYTDSRLVHMAAGYATLALVTARVVWGFKGSPAARFSNFVPTPRRLWRYLRAAVKGREPRHLGHNPAGAAMILFLMTAVTVIGVTGFLMGTDTYWGNEALEDLHVWTVDATLVAVAVHVSANIYASWHHQENLIQSMLTGDKPIDVPGHPLIGPTSPQFQPSEQAGPRSLKESEQA